MTENEFITQINEIFPNNNIRIQHIIHADDLFPMCRIIVDNKPTNLKWIYCDDDMIPGELFHTICNEIQSIINNYKKEENMKTEKKYKVIVETVSRSGRTYEILAEDRHEAYSMIKKAIEDGSSSEYHVRSHVCENSLEYDVEEILPDEVDPSVTVEPVSKLPSDTESTKKIFKYNSAF